VESATPLRVHIAPVGYEVRRVTEPLVRLRADRVYLVTLNAEDSAQKYWKDVHRVLRTEYKSIEVRDIFEEIWDFYRVLSRYGKIAREEVGRGNIVYVNVSTGTKVTAMVGLLSSMFWGTSAYYARTSYGGGTEVVHDIVPIPPLRFDVLPKEERTLLVALRREGRPLRKEEVIRLLRSFDVLPPIGELSEPATYRRLETMLNPLRVRGFIEVVGHRRAARVQVTDQGRAAVLLLEHLS
jgi:hypothetical protein